MPPTPAGSGKVRLKPIVAGKASVHFTVMLCSAARASLAKASVSMPMGNALTCVWRSRCSRGNYRRRFGSENQRRHRPRRSAGFADKRTDKLRSYGAALREIGFSGSQQGLRANSRAENSHQPVRRRILA
jgi:hypothetical protein